MREDLQIDFPRESFFERLKNVSFGPYRETSVSEIPPKKDFFSN